jgi:CRP/FNR family cyclic AMP-dependent transcriptional regulator
MLGRFQGDAGSRRLIDLLRGQVLLCADPEVAPELAKVATVRELLPGEILIRQGGTDNDLFFVLSGRFRIFVNGREVANRDAGQHLGEMAIIDPSSRRSATAIASEQSIIAQVDETAFLALADRNPQLWRRLALVLSQRLSERRKFHAEPNSKPILFIGSSKEHLAIAESVAVSIPDPLASTTLWSTGVFGASGFPVDDLETQVGIADFALLVAGADDQVTSRGVASDAPRDNVIFELGLFMGALSRSRTFVLVPKGTKIKLPTDLLGLNCLQFDARAADPIVSVADAVSELCDIMVKCGPK